VFIVSYPSFAMHEHSHHHSTTSTTSEHRRRRRCMAAHHTTPTTPTTPARRRRRVRTAAHQLISFDRSVTSCLWVSSESSPPPCFSRVTLRPSLYLLHPLSPSLLPVSSFSMVRTLGWNNIFNELYATLSPSSHPKLPLRRLCTLRVMPTQASGLTRQRSPTILTFIQWRVRQPISNDHLHQFR
jgi:hypothetical protein